MNNEVFYAYGFRDDSTDDYQGLLFYWGSIFIYHLAFGYGFAGKAINITNSTFMVFIYRNKRLCLVKTNYIMINYSIFISFLHKRVSLRSGKRLCSHNYRLKSTATCSVPDKRLPRKAKRHTPVCTALFLWIYCNALLLDRWYGGGE